jgi:hypothetical protein
MTLTQRLTRAGAAFIIFGTAAAMLPQTGEAKATTSSTTCGTHTISYRLTTDPNFTDTYYTSTNSANQTTPPIYAAIDTGSGYQGTTADYTYTDPNATLSPASGLSTTVTTTTTGALTGTFHINGSVYTVQYTVLAQ